jgi:hypothetical protein
MKKMIKTEEGNCFLVRPGVWTTDPTQARRYDANDRERIGRVIQAVRRDTKISAIMVNAVG